MGISSNIQDGDEDHFLGEINMIPFIDVMLVLLIISMVTTPFLEQGVNVELPSTQGQNLQKEQSDEPIIIFVSRDLNIRLGEKPIARAELIGRLLEMTQRRSNKEVFVRADKAVPYGVVADLMARVQKAGISRVGLVTQPESE